MRGLREQLEYLTSKGEDWELWQHWTKQTYRKNDTTWALVGAKKHQFWVACERKVFCWHHSSVCTVHYLLFIGNKYLWLSSWCFCQTLYSLAELKTQKKFRSLQMCVKAQCLLCNFSMICLFTIENKLGDNFQSLPPRSRISWMKCKIIAMPRVLKIGQKDDLHPSQYLHI